MPNEKRFSRAWFAGHAVNAKGNLAKVGTGLTALAASGMAAAQATSPGSAIATELAGGKNDQLLIIAAVAVMLGVLIVWAYVKRAR